MPMKVLKAKAFQAGHIVKNENPVDKDGSYVQFVKPIGVDIIPAILQPGELVVNKVNTNRILKLIDSHNEKAPASKDIIIPGLVDDGEQSESGDIIGIAKGGKVKRKKRKMTRGLPLKVSLDTRKPVQSISVRFSKPRPRQPRESKKEEMRIGKPAAEPIMSSLPGGGGLPPYVIRTVPPPPPSGPSTDNKKIIEETKKQIEETSKKQIEESAKKFKELQEQTMSNIGKVRQNIINLTQAAGQAFRFIDERVTLLEPEVYKLKEQYENPDSQIKFIPTKPLITFSEQIPDEIEPREDDGVPRAVVEEAKELDLPPVEQVDNNDTIEVVPPQELQQELEGIGIQEEKKPEKKKKESLIEPADIQTRFLKSVRLGEEKDLISLAKNNKEYPQIVRLVAERLGFSREPSRAEIKEAIKRQPNYISVRANLERILTELGRDPNNF